MALGDAAHTIAGEHLRAPGNDFVGRQVALLKGLDDHAQAVLDFRGHQSFVAHFDLAASLLHQFLRKLHRQWQLPQSDQAAQVAFYFVVGVVIVSEVAVDVPLIEIGCLVDGLTGRG